jgi:hypothetical protein
MWKTVQRCYYYKVGTKFFELDGYNVPPLRKWGVWVVLMKGAQEDSEAEVAPEQRRTSSSRRRHRRRLEMEAKYGKK